MQRFNIEIKAQVVDLKPYRETLQVLGAAFCGTDWQVDTYFKVPQGRLKLREGNIEHALIYYQRPNQKEPKPSEVILIQLTDSTQWKALLTAALSILIVVSKRREIYFLGNLKIHLDEIEGLGCFVEIEAIGDGKLSAAQLYEQCAALMNRLGIESTALCADSYSDMLLKIRGR